MIIDHSECSVIHNGEPCGLLNQLIVARICRSGDNTTHISGAYGVPADIDCIAAGIGGGIFNISCGGADGGDGVDAVADGFSASALICDLADKIRAEVLEFFDIIGDKAAFHAAVLIVMSEET